MYVICTHYTCTYQCAFMLMYRPTGMCSLVGLHTYYLYVHIYIYKCLYTYICMHVGLHMDMHAYMHTYTHTHTYTYIHSYMHSCTVAHLHTVHACMRTVYRYTIHIHVCKKSCTYVHTCTQYHTCIYTCIHR